MLIKNKLNLIVSYFCFKVLKKNSKKATYNFNKPWFLITQTIEKNIIQQFFISFLSFKKVLKKIVWFIIRVSKFPSKRFFSKGNHICFPTNPGNIEIVNCVWNNKYFKFIGPENN